MAQPGLHENLIPVNRRIRGEKLTPQEALRRTAGCQEARQELLRTAVAYSTSQWAQREYGEPCELPELIDIWRQQTGGQGDFEAWARSYMSRIRAAKERAARPCQAEVERNRGRRSASEPRHSQRQQQQQSQQRQPGAATAPPGHRRRSHCVAVAVPMLPFLYVPHPLPQPMVYASVAAGQNSRSQKPTSGAHHKEPGHPGASAADGVKLVYAVPVYLMCHVAVPAGGQHAAPPGQGDSEAVDTERCLHWHSSQEPRDHAATTTTPRPADSRHTRSRAPPGNFAQLRKTW